MELPRREITAKVTLKITHSHGSLPNLHVDQDLGTLYFHDGDKRQPELACAYSMAWERLDIIHGLVDERAGH